jgi:hypothetical protein
MANMMARMDVKVKVMLACGYGARLTRVYVCLQSAAAASLARHVLSDDSTVTYLLHIHHNPMTILRDAHCAFGSDQGRLPCSAMSVSISIYVGLIYGYTAPPSHRSTPNSTASLSVSQLIYRDTGFSFDFGCIEGRCTFLLRTCTLEIKLPTPLSIHPLYHPNLNSSNAVDQFEPTHFPFPHKLHSLQDPLQTLPTLVDFLRMRDQFPLGEELPSNLPELRGRLVDLGSGFVVLAEHGVSFAHADVGADHLTERVLG